MTITLRPSDKAWMVLGAGVLVYDMASPRGETLSEGVDRYRCRWPVRTHLVVVVVAAHLLRKLPVQLDPLHGFLSAVKQERVTRNAQC